MVEACCGLAHVIAPSLTCNADFPNPSFAQEADDISCEWLLSQSNLEGRRIRLTKISLIFQGGASLCRGCIKLSLAFGSRLLSFGRLLLFASLISVVSNQRPSSSSNPGTNPGSSIATFISASPPVRYINGKIVALFYLLLLASVFFRFEH